MSPIGRVFAVLNVFFAGAFLYHAGVYMERDAHWKTEYTTLEKTSDERISALEDQLNAETQRANAKDVQLSSAESARIAATTRVDELTKQNGRLEDRLSEVQADLKEVKDDYRTVASNVEQAFREAQQAREMAIEANQTKDQANRERDDAQIALRTAQDENANLNQTIASLNETITERDKSIREMQIKLDIVAIKAPGVLQTAAPILEGDVTFVGPNGRLVTVTVRKNDSGADILAGYSFAIYDANGNYKGEARVTSVNGNDAFCTMSSRPNGAPMVSLNDRASTNTNP